MKINFNNLNSLRYADDVEIASSLSELESLINPTVEHSELNSKRI